MPIPSDPIAWAVKAFRDDRAGRYATYRRYLEGDHPLGHIFTDTPARRLHNIRYNRCAAVVDAHADRLRVSGFGSDDPVERDADATAQAAEDLWNRTHMAIHAGQLATERFGMGDAYLLATIHPESGKTQFWPQDADKCRVHYDEEQPGVRDLGAKYWMQDDEYGRLNLYFADRIEKYITRNRARSGIPSSAQAFERYQPESDTTWPVRLPVTDTVPLFHIANNGRVNSYGTSELRDVLPLQDALNASLVRQFAAEHFLTWRQRLILNYDLSNDEDRAAMSALVTGMNQIIGVPANGPDEPEPKIAEFSAADMSQFDLVAEKWDIRIGRVSRVPIHYITGETKAQSGRAKRLDEAPFVEKMTDRIRETQPVLGDALEYGLRLEGVAVDPGSLRVNFESPAPMSEEDAWELAAMKADAGIPLEQIWIELGYPPDKIARMIEMKAKERELAAIDLGTFAPEPEPDDEPEA